MQWGSLSSTGDERPGRGRAEGLGAVWPPQQSRRGGWAPCLFTLPEQASLGGVPRRRRSRFCHPRASRLLEETAPQQQSPPGSTPHNTHCCRVGRVPMCSTPTLGEVPMGVHEWTTESICVSRMGADRHLYKPRFQEQWRGRVAAFTPCDMVCLCISNPNLLSNCSETSCS